MTADTAAMERIERAPTDAEITEYVQTMNVGEKLRNMLAGGAEFWTDALRRVPIFGVYIAAFWWSADRKAAIDAWADIKKVRAGYGTFGGVDKVTKYDEEGTIINKRQRRERRDIIRVAPREIRVFADRTEILLDTTRMARKRDYYVRQDTLETISTMLKKRVTHLADPQAPYDIWLAIGKAVAHTVYTYDLLVTERDGVSDVIDYTAQRDAAGKFALPVGVYVGRGKELLWVDITIFVHMYILGLTQMAGKTSAVRNIALFACALYHPGELRLVICDPKKTGFTGFEELPHMFFTSVAKKGEEILTQLETIKNMIDERNDFFDTEKIGDLKTYNAKQKRHHAASMPRVLVVLEELGTEIVLTPHLKKRLTFLAHYIQARGGSSGIHLLAVTQDFGSDFIPNEAKVNTAFRMTGRTATRSRSQVNLGRGGAEKITQPGLFMCQDSHGNFVVLQVPFTPVSAETAHDYGKDIPAVITAINNHWTGVAVVKENTKRLQRAKQRAEIESLLRYADDNMDGKFHISKLHSQWGQHQGITRDSISETAQKLEEAGILTAPIPRVGRVLWRTAEYDRHNPPPIDWLTINNKLTLLYGENEKMKTDEMKTENEGKS